MNGSDGGDVVVQVERTKKKMSMLSLSMAKDEKKKVAAGLGFDWAEALSIPGQ